MATLAILTNIDKTCQQRQHTCPTWPGVSFYQKNKTLWRVPLTRGGVVKLKISQFEHI
jgi:hypothetical protein